MPRLLHTVELRKYPWKLYPEKLPNEGSLHQTPGSLYIDLHYQKLELTKRWTWGRYVRLCNLMKMTPYEMASLVMMRHSSIPSYQRSGRIPLTISRPVAFVLTMLELHVLGTVHHDVVRNPLPDLNTALTTGNSFEPKTKPPL